MARIRCPAHGGKGLNCSVWRDARGRMRAKCWSRGRAERSILVALGEDSPTSFKTVSNQSQQHLAVAREIWEESRNGCGTLVEKYLRGREIELEVPATLRFHPGLKHPSGRYMPAMVAAVMDRAGQFRAIHRTFLSANASKANVAPVKAALGPIGGGTVWLAATCAGVIALAEGIETGLSILQAAGIAVWAVLGTSGMRAVQLPDRVTEVIIAADNDEPGLRTASDAARRLIAEGRRARIAQPPRGSDFNDLLRGVE